MSGIYIFDLDGTLANGDHRVHHILGKPKDWDSFFEECDKDEPIIPAIKIAQELSIFNEIYIFTGRNEVVRSKTERWLNRYNVPFDKLLMREEKDRTGDDKLKIQWLHGLPDKDRQRVVCIFEDRKRVVRSWRDAGYLCCQVADGDF